MLSCMFQKCTISDVQAYFQQIVSRCHNAEEKLLKLLTFGPLARHVRHHLEDFHAADEGCEACQALAAATA